MSRIFLSHSSIDEREAVALKQWLTDNGWDDVFLDIDPQRGLSAGERWQEALKRAADRCEAVLFVVTPAWAESKWCLAEFLLAKSLNKRIFGVVLKAVPLGELPTEMTAEWQLCHLVGEGATETIAFTHREQACEIAFLADGLGRLKTGLENAGLRADYFPWPPADEPDRAPYRGLEPLDAADAAVFFGRDVEILRALDDLRGMRAAVDASLFVILGASGAGKSSFLRAGLLPRLARDGRHFFPLQPVRPERGAISGAHGLAAAIADATQRSGLELVTPGAIRADLAKGIEAFAPMLHAMRQAARNQIIGLPADAPPPTLLLAVDQAEELFNVDHRSDSHAAAEADTFLRLIGGALRTDDGDTTSRHSPLIVAFTIRSERYEALQTAPALDGLRSVLFDALKPMPRTQFKDIITGPAQRASASGHPLDIHPDLVTRLLDDCQRGADTLPLLGLTLARLYRDFGGDGKLTLDEYQAMGGMADVIRNEAESTLDPDPNTREAQLDTLHDAFIPALVSIDPQSDQPMRRVAALSDLPTESHQLIQALVDKHLLLSDLRDGQQVIEVAHESLFRQWDALAGWLRKEAEELKEIDRLEQAVAAWEKSGEKLAWLMVGDRLAIAEALAAKPRYRRRLGSAREFLHASRNRETQRRDAEAKQRRAQIKRLRATVVAIFVALLAAVAGVFYINAAEKRTAAALAFTETAREATSAALSRSEAALRQVTGLRLAIEASAMLEGDRSGGDERALLQLAAAGRVSNHPEVDGALLNALVSRNQLQKIYDTGSKILSMAMSHDGTRIVSGSSDSTLRIWNATTGEPIGPTMRGHEGGVAGVAFSPDATRIASASWDGTLRVWDATTGQPIGVPFKGHRRGVLSAAFSADGKRIVSGSGDATVRLWDAQTGQSIGEPLQGHTDSVMSVAFGANGERIVSASWDRTARLWDAKAGQSAAFTMRGHVGPVLSVALNPDGTRIVTGSEDGTLRVWDATTGQAVGNPLKGHGAEISSVAFSPDGTRIVSGSADKTVRMWDATTGRPVGSPMVGHSDSVRSIAFAPDGDRIVSASRDNTLRVWRANPGVIETASLRGHTEGVWSATFSPDGTHIASGSADRTVRLWDAASGDPIGAPLEGHSNTVMSVAFAPDGNRIVSGSSDTTLRFWDGKTGQPMDPLMHGHTDVVRSVAFSPDSKRVVSSSWDKTLRLWDAKTGQALDSPLRGHDGWVWSVAISPDGTRLVSGSGDTTLRMWDANTGEAIGAPLRGHEDGVWSVAFSPDGRRIVSGSWDETLRLWDAETGQPIATPQKGHSKGVWSVAFSPDGTRIVSGGGDMAVRLWDATTGQPIGPPLMGHESAVWNVAFSPDGKRIVSSSKDTTLRLWPAPKVWPDLLCDKITRNMRRREWRDWVSPDIDYVCQCPGLPIAPDDPASDAAPEMCPAPST